MPRPQFVRRRVRENHPLSRLQGERRQPVDQLPVIASIELPQLKPLEELLQVFTPSLIAPRVLRPGRRCHLQLRGDDPEQRRVWGLIGREHPTRMAQVHHLDGQPKPIVIATVLTNVRKVSPYQGGQTDQLALILRKCEQLHPFTWRQQFASWHRNPSRMTRLSQLKYTLNSATLCHRKAAKSVAFAIAAPRGFNWDSPPRSTVGYRPPTRPVHAKSGICAPSPRRPATKSPAC